MISDLILSMFAFYFYSQHKGLNKLWSMFFLFMGLSAFVGGIYHGFPNIGEQFRFSSWILFSASLIYAQLAAYHSVKNKSVKIVFILKSVILLFLSILYRDFGFMVIDTTISMLGFVLIGNMFFISSLSKYINYGILISFVSAFFIIYKISFHPQHLTYNDIGHYISIISIVIISRGIRKDSSAQLEKVKNVA